MELQNPIIGKFFGETRKSYDVEYTKCEVPEVHRGILEPLLNHLSEEQGTIHQITQVFSGVFHVVFSIAEHIYDGLYISKSMINHFPTPPTGVGIEVVFYGSMILEDFKHAITDYMKGILPTIGIDAPEILDIIHPDNVVTSSSKHTYEMDGVSFYKEDGTELIYNLAAPRYLIAKYRCSQTNKKYTKRYLISPTEIEGLYYLLCCLYSTQSLSVLMYQ